MVVGIYRIAGPSRNPAIREAGIAGALLSLLAGLSPAVAAQAPVDFVGEVLPVLEGRCFRCHRGGEAGGRARKPKGDLRLDGVGWIRAGGEQGVVLVPGAPEQSPLYARTVLPEDHDDRMPGRGKPLPVEQTEVLRRWIAEGASFGEWVGEPGPAGAAGSGTAGSGMAGSGTAGSGMAEPSAEAASADDVPVALPHRQAVLAQVALGLTPLTPTVLERAAGGLAQIAPVVPGSPLLRVDFLSHEAQVDDAVVAQTLSTLRSHVAHLDLGRTAITDRALGDVVTRLPRLVHLDLRGTAVTDAGVGRLRALGELRYLNLYGTGVTDQGLAALAELARLEALYLWQTEVTDPGVATLQQRLPQTRIVHRLELPPPPPRSEGDESARRRRR